MPKAVSKTPTQKRGVPIPKTKAYGNSIGDRAWVEEMYAAGEVLEPDWEAKPDDFMDDVLYQWTGLAEDLDAGYFEHYRHHASASSGKRCNGTAYVRDQRGGYVIDCEWHRIRRPCLNPPMRGASVCQTHGGLVPNVREAAAKRLAMASDVIAKRLVRLTGTTDENQNPIEHGDRIKAINSALDRAGIRAGVEIEVNTPGYRKVLEDLFAPDEELPDGE